MRPGGNPELKNYQFSSDKPEPCTAKLTLRLPPSDYEKLKTLPNWQDQARQAIKALIAG